MKGDKRLGRLVRELPVGTVLERLDIGWKVTVDGGYSQHYRLQDALYAAILRRRHNEERDGQGQAATG